MKKLFLVIFGAFIVLNIFPRSVQITSSVLTEIDGLFNNSVYNIHRDKDGFIWFGTDLGISKYDGYHFTNYRVGDVPFAVRRIIEVDDKLFCLFGIDGTIVCFDSKAEKVLPIEFVPVSLSKAVFSDLYCVGRNKVCCLYKNELFAFQIDRVDDRVIFSSIFKDKRWQGKSWIQICVDDKNRLFALSADCRSLFYYDFENRISSVYDISKLADEYDVSNIACIFVHDNCLWLQKRWKGVFCYNLKNKAHRHIDLPEVNFDVRRVISLRMNNYCLVTWNGLFQINFEDNPTQGKYELIHFSDKSGAKINNAFISAMFDEKENVLWAATFGGGTVRYMLDNVFFRWIDLPQYVEVNKVIEDNNGYVWLTSIKHGLLKSDSNGISEKTQFKIWEKSGVLSGKCGLYKDKNGCIWVGDEHANFLSIDPETDYYTRYKIKLNDGEDFHARIYEFCLDGEGNMWIGTSDGLILFNREENLFYRVQEESVAGKKVSAIKEDPDGDIWIGTQNGLVRMIKGENGALKFVDGYEQSVGEEPSLVYSIFINSNNRTMIGYADKLLFIDNKHKDKIEKSFLLGDNLPNGHIYCITEDKNSNLWFGNNSGIMTMKVGTDLIYTYSVVGNNMEVCKLKDGRLFWITLDKLLYYDPDKIKNSLDVHTLLFSRLIINNNVIKVGEKYNGQVVLPQSVNTLDALTLNHENRNFTLFFTDLQYEMVGQKIYYRMHPDNEEWSVLDMRDGLTFTGLKSGRHILQVQSVAYDGNKGDIEEFVIDILPHWSVTWWAWSVYGMLLVGIIYAVIYFMRYRVRLYQRKYMAEEELKNQLYRTELKHKQERESVQIKNRFYGLLTNDLCTPLTMIINPLREILKINVVPGPLKKDVEIAYYNSIGLKDICTQLTNMYRMEVDYEYLQVAKWDISEILDSVVKRQQENLNAYHIDFHCSLPEKGMIEIWGDRDMLEFVIRLLLSNAYRHVIYTGRVELCVYKEFIGNEEFCVISVTDNGEEKVEQDVRDFLLQDNLGEQVIDLSRLELGFDLLEKIIAQHHGEIVFNSEEKTNTQIFIKLRSGTEHFAKDSKVVFVQSVTDTKLIEDSLFLPEMDLWNPESGLSSTALVEDRKKKLLVVEDNQTFRLYIRMTFSADYKVLEAENGQVGVEIALKELPDVILCDVMMPVKSGFDCCRELKGNLRTCHIPIIFLTARGMDDDIMNGMEMGADDYLQKPVNVNILKAKIAAIVRNREHLKQTYIKQLIQIRKSDDAEKENASPIEDAFIKKLIELVEEHMEEVDFSVTNLAKLMNMSQPTLYRRVKQSTDLNITELIRGVRLRKAAELLVQGNYSIQEVIEMVGYNDQASFRRHFLKLYNMTPSAYIKQYKSS